MTFKNIKFEESPIMRSLEKIAKEKGMIKEAPLKKEAESNLDLSISTSLMENILKLCAGLRKSGLNKQADELEVNFLTYKKANTLYETSKETGEDLVDRAHPNGSHKLEGVLGDSLVETILDKHLKMVDVVNKKPTGKLSSSSSIINAIKIALADDSYINVANEKFKSAVTELINLCNMVNTTEDTSEFSRPRGLFGGEYFTSKAPLASIERHLNAMVDNLKDELSKPIKSSYIEEHMRGYIREFNYLIRTSDNINSDRKKSYMAKANEINQKFTDAKNIIDNGANAAVNPQPVVTPAPAPVKIDPSVKILQGYSEVLNNIGLFRARIKARELSNADVLNKWLDTAENYTKKYQLELNQSQYKSDVDVMNSYTQKLETVKQKLEAFKQKWLQ